MMSANLSPRLAYMYSLKQQSPEHCQQEELDRVNAHTESNLQNSKYQARIQSSSPLIQSMVDAIIQRFQNNSIPRVNGAFDPIIATAESSPSLISMSPAFSIVSSPPRAIPYRSGNLMARATYSGESFSGIFRNGSDSEFAINIQEYPMKSTAISKEMEFNDNTFYSLFILLLILLILLSIFLYQVATF